MHLLAVTKYGLCFAKKLVRFQHIVVCAGNAHKPSVRAVLVLSWMNFKTLYDIESYACQSLWTYMFVSSWRLFTHYNDLVCNIFSKCGLESTFFILKFISTHNDVVQAATGGPDSRSRGLHDPVVSSIPRHMSSRGCVRNFFRCRSCKINRISVRNIALKYCYSF